MPLDIVRCRTLQATIWDCDRFQENMFLGAVVIPLNDLQANHEVTKWYPLTNYTRIWRSNFLIKLFPLNCDYRDFHLKTYKKIIIDFWYYTVCIYNHLFSNFKCFFSSQKIIIEKFIFWVLVPGFELLRLGFVLVRDWCGPASNWSSMRLRRCLCF